MNSTTTSIHTKRGVWATAASSILALGTLAPGPAHADGFESVPSGARAAAMGGVAHARGGDSASPTVNPAGLALIPGSIASLSASLYQLSAVDIPNFIADDSALPSPWGDLALSEQGVSSMQFNAFPSGLAYFYHLGDTEQSMVLAASLSVPRSVSRRFVENNELLGQGVSVKENLTTSIQDQSYVAALSFAWGSGALRIGASVLGGYTQRMETSEGTTLQVMGTAGFTRSQIAESESLHSFDAAAVLGAQLDLAEWISVGLALRTPSLHLTGSYESTVDFTLLGTEQDPLVSTMRATGDGVRGYPARVGGGLELRGEGWGLAFDSVLYLPRQNEFHVLATQVASEIGGDRGAAPDNERSLTIVSETRPVVNFALGGELEVFEKNWLRAGVFTDFSAAQPAEEVAERLGNARVFPLFDLPIDRFGASVGWGTKMGPVDTTFGLRGTYGTGTTLRVNPEKRMAYDQGDRADVTPATVVECVAFVSAALDLSDGAKGLIKHSQPLGE